MKVFHIPWAVVVALGVSAGAAVMAQQSQASERLMGEALHQEEIDGNLEAAIATYKKVAADSQASRATRALASCAPAAPTRSSAALNRASCTSRWNGSSPIRMSRPSRRAAGSRH